MRAATGSFNPFHCQSEGMRRLTLILAVTAVVAWVGYVWDESNAFSTMHPGGWVLLVAAPIGAYLAIMTIRLLVLWVIRGFTGRNNQ